ncbi:MAG: AAA family ATPase [Dysgonamonadaceae bacterium]|jgi:hypothetical protein|nr:AAA family ATPase [Dysgonamonadaceae bacterium]
MQNLKSKRVIFHSLQNEKLTAKTADNQVICVICSESQIQELAGLSFALHEGNMFNLLNIKEIEENVLQSEFIIFEPDYLVDISSLSECFKPYGAHPLNYTLARMQNRTMTAPILLGNTANFFIDEFVNEDLTQPVEFVSALKKLFRTAAFECTACEDLKNPKQEQDFFRNCHTHFKNIRYAVQHFFPKAGIDKEKVVLEPSFISNALGLQGRLDIMLCDFSKFIELKSGKAVEDFRSGGTFIHSAENHYMQMILYLAVLEFNLNLSSDAVDSYLLYSKYPVLSREKHSRKHLQTALSLRNQIVARDYILQKNNDLTTTENLLNSISSQNLNAAQLTGKFFDNYLAPSIDQFPAAFSTLNTIEKHYFLRLYTFITKELWLSKAGEREYEGLKKASVLWNASIEDKLLAGEILYNLKIVDNQAASETHTITLNIPEYADLYLPNFRPGDAVVLYERNNEEDTVNNRQVFKGSIESLAVGCIKIRLRYRQKNRYVWNEAAFYAVEHDYMDTIYTGMYRALNAFLYANPGRKKLLTSSGISESANEIFLLIGPPGSGKTSITLKNRVETEIKNNHTNILLLSYTNRAVDEICKALIDIHSNLPFIRIGSELNCAPEFRNHLLENQLENCEKRSDVAGVIRNCRIFVGTAASVCNKPELFLLKHFDWEMIDEATQLLEPHLLGVFCIKNPDGNNAVDRFLLIGDHKQLPAVVLQTKDESRVSEPGLNAIGLTDLSESLFERLYRQFRAAGRNDSFAMLNKQGRMHPAISEFPSKYFYDNQLGCAGLPHQTEEWNNKKRLYFYPVKPSEQETATKSNSNEAEQVVAICRSIYQDCLNEKIEFQAQSIGIITPFRNQIALIRKLLQSTGIEEFKDIVIDTVERFQGSQRDIIIYSFCIKTEFQLAALPHCLEENGRLIDRKLNVAITRAKKQLYLLGNEELLSKNALYRELIKHIRKNNVTFAGD